jgi:hypothetical protein
VNRRHLIGLLLLINLALIAGIVLQSRSERPNTDAGIEIITQQQTNPVPVINVAETNPASVKLQWPPFRWSEIETNDYVQLTENLIRIGCPRQTIRDLVTARILDDYAEQLWTTTRPIQDQVWDLVATGLNMSRWEVPPYIEERVIELESSRQAVLKLVTARIGEAPEIPTVPGTTRWRFLDDEDFALVKEVYANYGKLRGEFQKRIEATEDAVVQKELTVQMSGLRTDLNSKLKALLGEEKWNEYLLRSNRNARWSDSLVGTSLTAEEIREVTEARREAETTARSPDLPEEDQRPQRQLAIQETTEKALKPERLAEIERSRDNDYRTWQKIGRRLNLPPIVANRAYEYKQVALQQATAIAANQFLDDDSRKLAYIALQLEVSKEISGIYGEAWTTYEKYGGAWIANLAPARAAK